MAKSGDTVKGKGVDPDAQLVADVRDAFRPLGYSPGTKIENMLARCHPNFRELTRRFAGKMLELADLQKLDSVIANENINSSDPRWVSNVRHLTTNALQYDLLETMVAIHALLNGTDLQEEVWSILKEPYDKLCATRRLKEEQQALASQTALAGIGHPIIVGVPAQTQPAAAPVVGGHPTIVGGPVQTQPAGVPSGQQVHGPGQPRLPGMPKIP